MTRTTRTRTTCTRLGALVLALPLSLALPSPAFAAPADQPGSARSTQAAAKAGTKAAPHGAQTTSPWTEVQPVSTADARGTGANAGDPCTGSYCSTRDGSASGNGNGGGRALGKPCAGCVGKADNKDPLGQQPGGTDANNGYECDGNAGIARTNPAHTACSATPDTTPDTPAPAPQQPVEPATPAQPEVPAQPQVPVVPQAPAVPGDGGATVTCPDGSAMPAGATSCSPDTVPADAPVAGPRTAGALPRSLGGGALEPATVVARGAVAPREIALDGAVVTPSVLPFTGDVTEVLAGLGGLLVAAGTALAVTGRRRETLVA